MGVDAPGPVSNDGRRETRRVGPTPAAAPPTRATSTLRADAPAPPRAPLALEMAVAASAIDALLAGSRLDQALVAPLALARGLSSASRAPVRDMASHATRTLGLTGAIAQAINRQPPAAPLGSLQRVALSQLIEPIRHPAVIVDQAVEGARLLGVHPSAAAFLNASLRRFVRERETLIRAALADPVARWNHPRWWIDRLHADHGQRAEQALEVSNTPPPLTVRVNLRRTGLRDYRKLLEDEGLSSRVVGEQALVIEPACEVARLPGWDLGWVSVQDAGAQLAAMLMPVRPGDRVLDACAAPGGKTTHLLERHDCRLVALDQDAARLARVASNLERLGLAAQLVQGDAARPGTWWDREPFEHILVDAPCSASGVSRRVPDARWLRRRGDLTTLAAQQLSMLEGLWPLLRGGGTLLFATCSVFRAEGPAVVERFLASRSDAHVVPIPAQSLGHLDARPASDKLERGITLLPIAGNERDHDGFYYCLIGKRA
jgi:16S rRNA (cytosine967-C5)-methyltransferase